MDLRSFLRTISHYQEQYFSLEEFLKNTPNLSAGEVTSIYQQKQFIAGELVRFVFNQNVSVEIVKDKLLEK